MKQEELVKAIDHRTLAERTATNICSACKHSTDDGPTPGKRCEGCYKVGFMSFEDRDVQEALVSLHFICPFTGLKFAFHRQDQVDMLQKHYEFFAAKDDALIRQNKALVGALKEYRSLHDGCLIIPENGYDRRCSECKDADAALAGQDAASEKGEPR